MKPKAIIFDLDGTLCELGDSANPYNHDGEEYQEFMEWRKNKRKISASIHKESKAVEYDDCPF